MLHLVLKTSGLTHPTPHGCTFLASEIQRQTGRQLSVTTLKRLYGFASYQFSASAYTLDTLANYIGRDNWQRWQEHFGSQDCLQIKKSMYSTDFSKLFYLSNEAMWIFEIQNMRFLEVNEAACYIYGYSREQFLSMTILEIRPPGDHSQLAKTISEAGEYCHHQPFIHTLANGDRAKADLRSFAFSWGGIKARLVSSRLSV